VLERLTSILCVSFARCLRIFEAVASTENYQTFLPPKFNVVAEPAIRSRLKVEVFVYEIVATLALPEQSACDWCPYYCHINHIYHIYNNTRKCGPFVGSHARFLEAPEFSSSSSRQALTHPRITGRPSVIWPFRRISGHWPVAVSRASRKAPMPHRSKKAVRVSYSSPCLRLLCRKR
jgi:hypothetical protein